MSNPISQNHLTKTTAEIRSRNIPWEGYQRAQLISEVELAQIRQYEKNPSLALSESGQTYITLFISLLNKLVRVDTIQNILVLIDDILIEYPNHAHLFFADQSPFPPFLKLLRKEDEYIQLKSCQILVTLVTSLPEKCTDLDPHELFSWIITQLSSTTPSVVDLIVQYIQVLVSVVSYRSILFNNHPLIQLIDLLKKQSTSAQMQYQIVYILWLMTFQQEVCQGLNKKYNVIPVFLDIAKNAIKEKVIRVIVATLRNILEKAPLENMVSLLGNKALNVCEILAIRKWGDEEITLDVEFLKSELTKSVASLSTFDEYSTEVRAGTLEWSPAHNSEQFWKMNSERMNEKDYELLRSLARLITTSEDPIVLAVAAHDFGQYIKYYPNGKKILENIGAKTRIMELMGHADGDVRYQALLATQKFMASIFT